MRKCILLCAIMFLYIVSSSAAASENNIRFRPILSENELEGKKFDCIHSDGELICAWRLSYLTDRDIASAEMLRSATKADRLFLGLIFNKEGEKRLYHYVMKFGKRRLAIFAGGKVLLVVPATPPVFLGNKVIVPWRGTNRELRDFVFKVNKKPQSVISLYIEEQAQYNDVAAEAWADAYENVNKYMEGRRSQNVKEKALVEAARDDF